MAKRFSWYPKKGELAVVDRVIGHADISMANLNWELNRRRAAHQVGYTFRAGDQSANEFLDPIAWFFGVTPQFPDGHLNVPQDPRPALLGEEAYPTGDCRSCGSFVILRPATEAEEAAWRLGSGR